MIIRPKLVHEDPAEHCLFSDRITGAKLSDFVIQTLPYDKPLVRGVIQSTEGYIAVRIMNTWTIERASITYSNSRVNIDCLKTSSRDVFAYPVDPRMTEMDIEGATKIFPNTANTGWLFSHAEQDHHHDRIFTLQSVMSMLFRDVEDDAIQKYYALAINDPTNTNRQRGEYSKWTDFVAFRKECLKWCAEYEKLLHIGQHIQESDLHIHDQLLRAIEEAKKVWVRDNSDNWNSISFEVEKIIAHIKNLHTFETRWEKMARREAEAKAKKAAADAANSESEGSEQ